MFRRVAIIGGGAAGAALLSELVAQALARAAPAAALHLDWFTGVTGPLARGVAYATDWPHHLLDVRAASMSMFAGKPRGFLDFAQRNDPAAAGTDFLPRRLYGDYLEAEVGQTLAQARGGGIDVRVMPLEVDAVVPETGAVTLVHGERNTRVDAAVLALGALPPQPLAGVGADALASGRYVVDPWPLLARVQPDAAPRHVLLLGSGLTAVDVLLELSERWPDAHFTVVSPHGQLPEPHLPVSSAPADDSAELVEALGEDPSIRRWLRLLRETMATTRDWRVVVDSLRLHTPTLWASLPDSERSRFLRHARWAWERARHRMPPQVAARMAELEQAGRMQRRRGRMLSVRVAGERLELQFAARDDGAASTVLASTVLADLAIQATGLETDVRRTPHRLLSQLRTNRHITPDPHGLGLRAMPDGRVCRDGQPWSRLWAIGSLLRGTLWESSAMPEIRQQARGLAARLLAD